MSKEGEVVCAGVVLVRGGAKGVGGKGHAQLLVRRHYVSKSSVMVAGISRLHEGRGTALTAQLRLVTKRRWISSTT